MSALDTVRDEIVGKARAQGFELAPWFESNQNRLRVFSDGLQRILGRLPLINGDGDRARAENAHGQLRSAIERGSMSTNEIRELCIGRGMRTLRVEGVSLLRKGVTTVDEIIRVTR